MRPKRLALIFCCLLALTLIGATVAAGLPVFEWARSLDAWVLSHPGLAALLLFLVTCCWSLFLPTMLPTLLGGFWFGLLAGSVIIYSATTLACIIAFLGARHFLHDSTQAWLAKRPRLRAMQGAMLAEGWRTVLLMRLSPVVPFSIQNWLYGASRIGFWTCLSATLVGKLPNTLLTVAAGMLARVGLEQRDHHLAGLGLGLAVVATFLLLWSLGRIARRALSLDVEPEVEL